MRDEDVTFAVEGVRLEGHVHAPEHAPGVVLFAHGSGSSRHSPRNQQVAATLQEAGCGTFLFDLLTPDEARDRSAVFDVRLLARRLLGATRWLRSQPFARDLHVGYFGASTGAAAALWAASEPDNDVAAIVSRGGRPDLAAERLATVRAPTLLIVGGDDRLVLELNRQAAAQLPVEHRLEVIPGATHLFEEPGALEEVARLAAAWFGVHLVSDVGGGTGSRHAAGGGCGVSESP